jgi:hypothetical protein
MGGRGAGIFVFLTAKASFSKKRTRLSLVGDDPGYHQPSFGIKKIKKSLK